MQETQLQAFKFGGDVYTVRYLEGDMLSLTSAERLEDGTPGYISRAVLFDSHGTPVRVEVVGVLTLGEFAEKKDHYTFDVSAEGRLTNGTQRSLLETYPEDPAAWEADARPTATTTQDTGEAPYTLDATEATQVERLLRQFSEARTAFLEPA
ncbi:MAG: hypothetical protein J0L97_07760 [Alphaproteobacteria bacterium]|nr:hypothetical protein [Alphaproteobacteria bacterium]